MSNHVRRSGIVFGMCAITVSVFSGCATHTDPARMPMSTYDLNHTFQVDCSRKQEQIEMLQSMRPTRDEQMAARLRTIFQPWTAFTNPAGYVSDQDVGINNHEKYINYHLNQLRYCP